MSEQLRKGYKQTEIGVIPSDWRVKKLGKLSFITKLAGFEYSLYFNSYNDGGDIIVVRGTNITHNKMDLSDVKNIPVSTSNNLKRSKLYKNDLVFAYVGTIGPIYLVEEDDKYHLGPNTSKIRVEKELDSKYLYHYFTSSFIKKEILEHTSVGAQPSLSMEKIRSFNIITPTLKEQTAIANALSDTDTWINSLEQLLTKKRQIKQGAMQELLQPKEGWEVKKLTDVVDYIHGKAHEQHIDKFGKYVVVNSKFVSTEGEVIKYSKMNFCPAKKDDLLTVLSDLPNGKALAKCYYVNENDKYAVNQRICIWRSKGANQKFLFYILNRLEYFLKLNDGVSQTHILNHHIEKCEISVPKNKEEQTRIATILSDMDDEIAQLETKLAKAKQIKQGMMQELLTGRIRLV